MEDTEVLASASANRLAYNAISAALMAFSASSEVHGYQTFVELWGVVLSGKGST
jgi:hypothetical protein